MKKVYYLVKCGSGTFVHYDIIDLIKENGSSLLFHKKAFDWKTGETRIFTLKATRKVMRNINNDLVSYIDFRSTREEFYYYNIKEFSIPDDVTEPKKYFIIDSRQTSQQDIINIICQ